MVHGTPTAGATEPASAVASTENAEIPTSAPQGSASLPEMTPLYSTGFTPLSPKNHAQVSVTQNRICTFYPPHDLISAPSYRGGTN
jgi:hypothetical protein